MDKETLVFNIERCARAAGVSPSRACIESGAGKSFISDIRRGQTPSVSKVADLAAYLGVSTSELVGDVRELPQELLQAWAALNEEGQQKVTDYAQDLVAGGRYIKNNSALLEDPTNEIKDA